MNVLSNVGGGSPPTLKKKNNSPDQKTPPASPGRTVVDVAETTDWLPSSPPSLVLFIH